MKTKLAVLATIAFVLSACGAAATTVGPNADALAHDAAIKTLDAGKLNSLATGPVYIRFIRFVQPAGKVIQSKQHVASIVYVESGAHRLTLNGQAPVDLLAGQAKFHQSVAHTHLNPGPGSSVWYSIALWPSSARGQPLVDPIAEAAYQSGDLIRETLPQVAYSQVLRQITLAKAGTTGAHRFGGISSLYELSGSVTVRIAHKPSVTLGPGQGIAFLPDVPLQETNAGPSQAVFLEFLTTAVGRDFDVPLQQPPAA